MSTLDNSSPQYFVRHWRKPETQTEEEILESFLNFVEMEYEDEPEQHELHLLKLWINAYLQRDMSKVKAGEREMLKAWKEAAR